MFRSARDILSWKRETDWYQLESTNTKPDPTVNFKCNECSEEGWSSETDLELHRVNEHISYKSLYNIRSDENYCAICIQKFADSEEVLKHIKTEHLLSTENATRVERKIFVCNECSAIFFNKSNLTYHTSYWHSAKVAKLVCPFCNKIVRSTYYLSTHFYKHVKKSISTCRICLLKCKSTAQLRDHYRKHPYFLKCEMCGFETNRIDLFHNHLQTQHKADDKMELIANYEKYFIPKEPSYVKLQKIISLRGLRLANNLHICIICREICFGDDQMGKHIYKHKEKESEVLQGYVCPCGQVFTNKVLYKHHMFKSKHKI